MSNAVILECFCGNVKGEIQIPSNKKSFHVHCLYCDCQKFASYLENEGRILDQYGGSELFQTYPSYIKIDEGKDKISCLQYSEKGLFRWYASCCNTPVANTMSSPKIPFAGVSVKFMKFESESTKEQILGPVIMKAFGKYARGERPKDTHENFPKTFIVKIIQFMFRGFLISRNKPNPFFKNGKPITIPKTI